jgi:magnesium transporter
MIRSINIMPDGSIQRDLGIEMYQQVLQDSQNLFWVDFSAEPPPNVEPIFRDVFGFHILAIEDALTETHIPKVDDWGTYLYLVLRVIQVVPGETIEIQIPELDIFLGPNYIVTYHDVQLEEIETIWQTCQQDQRYSARGVNKLFYHLADEMVNQYMPVIERLDELIDQIEDEVFDNPKPRMLNKIFGLKRALQLLRRTLLPQREVFNKLARGDFDLVQESHRFYFRDIYDHMVHLQEINESLRDLVSGALDTYLSVVNNRMNEIMKTLTVITTLFMPISFLTGFFGMNFFQSVIHLDAWTGKQAFTFVLIGIFFIPLGMYLWMRRRAWM